MENIDRAEFARLREENAALKDKLARSEAVQAILAEALELFDGLAVGSPPEEESEVPVIRFDATDYATWLKRTKLN